jgi:hypothetical protein
MCEIQLKLENLAKKQETMSSTVAARDVEPLVLDLGLCGDAHWRTRLHSVTLALAAATAALRLALPKASASESAAIEAILQRDESVRISAVAQLIAALLRSAAFATKQHLFGFVGAPADPHVVRFQAIHADIQRDRLDVADALAAFLRVRDERDAAHHAHLDTLASVRAVEDGLRAVEMSVAASRRAMADACARIGVADSRAAVVADQLEQLVPQLTAACDSLASMLNDPLIGTALSQIGERVTGEALPIVRRVGADSALLLAGKQREQLLCALVELRSFQCARLVALRSAADDGAAIDAAETNRIVSHLDAVRKALAEPRFVTLLRLATPALRQQLAREIESPQSAIDMLTRKGDELRVTLVAVQARLESQAATLREIDDRLELARVELGELLSDASNKRVDISL